MAEVANKILRLSLLSCDSATSRSLSEISTSWFKERIGKLCRLAAAIGGFLMMVGMILVGILVLCGMNIVDVGAFADESYLLMLMLALFSVGVLDLIAGVILSRR